MNNGAFGENFPYSNYHDLNMDWIIKIARDFLDQYTHIQEMISEGEESLQNTTSAGIEELEDKADALEALLQQWYNTHSADIANQLAQAIQSFTTQAQAIGAEVIASIPEEYTELTTTVTKIVQYLTVLGTVSLNWNDGVKINTSGAGASDANYSFCSFVTIPPKCGVYVRTYMDETASIVIYDSSQQISGIFTNANPPTDYMRELVVSPANATRYVRASCLTANKAQAFVLVYPTKAYIDEIANNTNKSIREMFERNGVDDMDDTDSNRVYTITTRTLPNLPVPYNGISEGTCMTFNGDSHYVNGQVQLHVTADGLPFIRVKWDGVWKPWMDITGYGVVSEFSGIEMFDKFAVIGDSYSHGLVCTTANPSGRDYENCRWGDIIAKRNGRTYTDYGWSGCSTYSFCDTANARYNTSGLGKLISDLSGSGQCGFYALALGINDSNSNNTFGDKTGGLNYLGTSADINPSDPSQNANSFWGNYGKIIQTIMNANSKIRLALLTVQRTPSPATAQAYDAYNEAIREIASYFNIPVIELKNDLYFTSSYWMSRMVGYHPTAPQYAGMAKAIERLISKTITQNYNYFREYDGLT